MDEVDSHEEYDYEETIVMVELQGIMENDFLGQVSQAKMLGIDTEKPLLQLDDYTFTGQYSDTLGTNLVFQDKTETNDSRSGEKKLEYSCLTNKKLSLQRVFLKDNNELTQLDSAACASSDDEQNDNDATHSPDASPGPSEIISEAAIDRGLNKDLVADAFSKTAKHHVKKTSTNSEQADEKHEKT
ncbi:general transcription factor 3C polypeptide 6-like [Mercenaria mercenaria]|uniref:general transcription factor 3C polypeptide 6-like n=1 Tax=Mercenaria mercenaria TaxID=6596 RepID=UPI001E1DD866|nr:general transcription factor 3C polypeptide 6-like [Mercenaria mercenaria]